MALRNFCEAVAAIRDCPTRRGPFYLPVSLIAAFLCLAGAGPCEAGPPAETSGKESTAAADDPAPATGSDPASWLDRDIVVTARRGEALVEPETELDEERIATYGAFSIRELIGNLAPLIGGRDKPPALLVNGQRVGDTSMIEGFPPEALNRLAILPPEAAARYGYPAEQRVVNIVLKPHFASWTTGSTLTQPTSGGRDGETLSVNRVAIDGPAYWSTGARLGRESRLLRSQRFPEFDDEDRYKSLFPSTHNLDVNAGITHPVGDFSGSLSLNAGASASRGLLGQDESRVLQERQDSRSVGVSAGLSGSVGDFRTNIAASYGRSWSKNLFGKKAPLRVDRSSSRNENWSVQLNVDKMVSTLPAGPLTSNFAIGGSRNTSFSRRSDGYADTLQRDQLTTQMSLAIPITSRRMSFLAALGDISVDLTGGMDMASREKRSVRYSAGLSWSPIEALDLRGSTSFSEMVPSVSLLNAPRVETTARLYDYARQETTELIWISGGNPDLRRGSRHMLSLRASLRPFGSQLVTLTTYYQREVARGGITSFPQLTPATERVFAGRIVRDTEGRLVSIDARPIPIERDLTSQLSSGVTLFFAGKAKAPVGAVPKARIWDNGQITMSLTHNWQLRSELLIAPGLPVLDRLGGDGGQSNHTLGLQVNAGWPGLGGSLAGNWQSAVRVRDAARPDGQGDFLYPATAQFNFGLFVEPGRLLQASGKKSWLSKLRLTFDVQNLFDTYRRVRLADGSVPAGYRRHEIDPLGRTIQIGVQKQF